MCADSKSSTMWGPRRLWRSYLFWRLMVALVLLCSATRASADEPLPPPSPQRPAPQPRDYDAADPDRNVVTYLHAAANVSLINVIIYAYDWSVGTNDEYWVTGRDIIRNHTFPFAFDPDKLDANFLGHPIDGAMYFGAARATGLGFWETTPYVLGGSLMWEMLSENQKPSANDLIVTSVGGVALGEVLYRLSSRSLDDSRSGFARLTRELAGFLICPPRGGNRAVTGEAWADGPPPTAKHARIVAHAGLDRVTAGSVTSAGSFSPSFALALDAEYGDLLPAPKKRTVPAFDFFDLYVGGLITSQRTSGLELNELGLLHGWSRDVSSDEGELRDNNVLGFFQSFDYQATNMIEFGALGIGLGDVLVVRGGPRKRLRLGLDVEWAPIAGMRSTVYPDLGAEELRDYNFSTGASLGLAARWDIGRAGQLGLSAREYATTVIDGVRGEEHFGYARLWYEVDAIRDRFGVGMAPKLVHRRGSYTLGRTDAETQLSVQFYATLRL